MSNDAVLAIQWGLLALFTLGLLVVWADVGNYAFVRKWSGVVRFGVGLLLVGGMIGVLFAPVLGTLGPAQREGGYGPKLSADWRLASAAEKKQVRLEELRGKVLFINIWATWCGPCLREMPSIEALYKKFKGRDDVAFLLVAVDNDPKAVLRHLATSPLEAPVYIPMEQAPPEFATEGIPATFIIDKEGRLEQRTVGANDWGRDFWVEFIDRLSKRPAKPEGQDAGRARQ
jgi:thiol-disulfide isomerase/thioredoxin